MFETIVAGTDGSATALEAVRVAGGLAEAFGAELHLVRAYRTATMAPGAAAAPEAIVGLASADEMIRRDIEAAVAALVAEVAGRGVAVTGHACPCGPVDALVSVAERVGADLIVVGNRGMQGARRVLGSVPNSVTHKAPCSVLVVDTTRAAGSPQH